MQSNVGGAGDSESRLAPLRRPKGWERWLLGVVALVTVVLSLILAVSLWLLYRSVERSYRSVVQGEGAALIEVVHSSIRGRGRRLGEADLKAVLAEASSLGLRYVAVAPPQGRGGPWLAAGEPVAPVDFSTFQGLVPMRPETVAGRIRMMSGSPAGPPRLPHLRRGGAPPGHDGPHARDGARLGPEGEAGELERERGVAPRDSLQPIAPPRPPPPRILVEFEPIRAQQIAEAAREALVVGLVTVPAVLLGGIFLIYLVRQRDELGRRLEHERRLAALGEMTAVIAHEIRNPLASLKGHAQLLERSLGEDERAAKAELVVREAVRLQDLVSDLLEFSRSGTLEPREVSPAAVLRESVEATDAERIAIDDAGAPASWRLDPTRMRQALSNLLRNAIQASADDAMVEASVLVRDGRLVYEVRDHGAGIAPGDEERIFSPFFTRKLRGTGLGLPLVRRIVEQHGGEIDVQNDPAGGAVFRIRLART